MKLEDFASAFSRQFVVGFFVPTFFGLAIASLLVTPELLPDAYEQYSAGTRLLILGALAIPLGIALQGFNAALLRGVTQQRSGADPYRYLPSWFYSLALRPEQRTFSRLKRLRDHGSASLSPTLYELIARVAHVLRASDPAEQDDDDAQTAAGRHTRATAATRLEERYPEAFDDLLPTRLGNTLRATQEYAYSRWGLDTWAVWPRIQTLLSEQERELVSDSEAELAFFLNSALVAFLVGVLLLVDSIWHSPLPLAAAPLYAIPFILSYLLYRLSIGAAVRWGAFQRAAVDLHRLELLEKIGFPKPSTLTGQYAVARALNRFLLYRPPGPSDTCPPGEELLAFSRSAAEGILTPLNPDAVERLGWEAYSLADQRWLETDSVIYGMAFATKGGARVDPREVVIGRDGIARRRVPS